jgi:predicted nucleic acid-binding protein
VSYLVDTNVISEVRKGSRCDPAVAAWWAEVPATEIFLSVLTIGEIRKGIENLRRRDVRSAIALENWLSRVIRGQDNRILGVDLDIVEEWGRMNVPDPLPAIDSLIAATAKVHGLTLVTRNIPDMARTGVDALNPWTA